MPVGRTPPRRASRGSGTGYGKREKRAVVPFTPDPEKTRTRPNARGGRGRGGRGGRGSKRANDDGVVNKVRSNCSRKGIGRSNRQEARDRPEAQMDDACHSGDFGCPRATKTPTVRSSIFSRRADRSVPRVSCPPPQYAQAKTRIYSQMSVIRQQMAMIEAYDMDGWRGARCAHHRSRPFVSLGVRSTHTTVCFRASSVPHRLPRYLRFSVFAWTKKRLSRFRSACPLTSAIKATEKRH